MNTTSKIANGIISTALAGSFLFAGCSTPKTATSSQEDAFFKAFNALFEADSLSCSGSVGWGVFKADFNLWIDNTAPMEIAMEATAPFSQPVDFYLKDGKTYLNFMGTKSHSLAANIGISDQTTLDPYNPFLDLTSEQRHAMFENVTVSGDTYTFMVDTQVLENYIDSFGSIDVSQAQIQAVIQNEQLTSMQMDFSAHVLIQDSQTDINGTATVKNIVIDQPLNIPWPDDLASY